MGIPLRVLMVEDSEDDALLVLRALRRGGYDVSYERVDNREALKVKLQQPDWDIVITDYAMPGFSGMGALEIVNEMRPGLPIIIVSGTIGEEVAVQAMKSGAYDYVMKDKLARLVPAVHRELEEARVRQARQRAEEDLRKLSRAVEQSPIAVMITDTDGVLEYVNPRFTQLSGYTSAEVIGQTPKFLQSGFTSPAEYARLWETIAAGQEWGGEFLNRKKNGEHYWVSASISPIFNARHQITHYLAIEEDITARKAAEEEQAQLLERGQRQHTTIVRLVTHPALAAGQFEAALTAIAAAAAETLGVDRVNIWQLSPDGSEIQCRESYHRFMGPHVKGYVLKTASHRQYFSALQTGRIIDAADVTTDPRTRALAVAWWQPQGVHAVIEVPIHAQGQVLGVVCHEYMHGPRHWHADEVSFATQIADLVAQAYLNADLRRRAQELSAITRVSREITSVPDLQAVFHSIARHAAELSRTDASGVFAFRENGQLYIAAGYGVSDAFMKAIDKLDIAPGQGAIGKAAEARVPVQISDIEIDAHYEFRRLAELERIRAILAVPMLREDDVIGGIVLWHHQPRYFAPQEVTFIQALAQQCINAVENARLFEAEARRRREAETLSAVTQALSTSLDLHRVLELILSQLQQVVPYDSASVQQLKGNWLEVVGGRGFPNIEELLGVRFALDSPIHPNVKIIRTREPYILEDAPQHYAAFNEPPHADAHIRAWMGVPLIFGDRIIGMIALDKKEPGFYTSEHARLAGAFAAQAAIALENARIFAQEEQRAQELARALEQQKELDRLKDQFIQNVSHELRTPIAIARGYAEWLELGELGPLQPEQEEPITIIARRMRMLSSLVDDINAILEVETQEPRCEPVHFDELAHALLSDFRAAANRAGLTLEEEIAPELPPIMGDVTHFRRLLDNLLGNALKFTAEGGEISLRLYQQEDWLVLQVTDTGIGIPEDKLARIFDRFYQVDGSMSRRYGGTGLGLALVKGIVNAHQGVIDVKSKLGAGSTFTVKLPLAGPASE